MTISKAPVKAEIKLEIDNNLLKTVETALKPESNTPSSDRSNTSVAVVKNQLVLYIEASDTTALRASLNSYLRWVQGIQRIVKSIE
jgi:KEOPS complex subunit Pcc1